MATAAVLLGAFLAALLYTTPALWSALVAVSLAPAAWEWGRLARLPRFANAVYTLVLVAALAAFAGLPAVQRWEMPLFALASLFWVLAAPLCLRRWPPLPGLWLGVSGMLLLTAAFVALLELRRVGPGLLLAIMAIVWVSDTAAFATGSRYGRRKLAPSISPGKTWEGVWGALVAVAVYAISLAVFVPGILEPAHGRVSGWRFVAIALVLAVLGIVGDLFESRMKRSVGLKDSGRLLPGHGGVLDRIDALIPVLPAAAWLFGQ